MDSLGPLLPHVFDRDAEAVTLKILRTISRYENADDLSEAAVSKILLDDAVRGRIGAAKDIEEEIEIVDSALVAENKRLEEEAEALRAKKMQLADEVSDREAVIGELKETIDELKQARATDKQELGKRLEQEAAAREEVEARLLEMDRRREARLAWMALAAKCAVLSVPLAAGITWILLQTLAWAGTAPWFQILSAAFLWLGAILQLSTWLAGADPRLSETRGNERLKRASRWIWVTVILGTLLSIGQAVVQVQLLGAGQ